MYAIDLFENVCIFICEARLHCGAKNMYVNIQNCLVFELRVSRLYTTKMYNNLLVYIYIRITRIYKIHQRIKAFYNSVYTYLCIINDYVIITAENVIN